MSYLDGAKDKVSVQMYKGRAIGISFPNDPNRHHESWKCVYAGYGVMIYTRGDELYSIEVDLGKDVTGLETRCD